MENTKTEHEFRITGFVMVHGFWYGYRVTNGDVDEVTYMGRNGIKVLHDDTLFYLVREQAHITDPALRLITA